MESVANHLQDEAVRRAPAKEADKFGRTAFNRYYYAAFLEVKAGLAALRPEWSNQVNHADMPQILRVSVKKTLAEGRRLAAKADDHRVIRMCDNARTAVNELATLLDEGRATRVTADYHPDIPINFTQLDFELNSVGVRMARQWPQRAKLYMQTIRRAWEQL